MRNVLDKFIDKIGKHVLWPVTFFFWKLCPLSVNVEDEIRAGDATCDNMAHAVFSLVTNTHFWKM